MRFDLSRLLAATVLLAAVAGFDVAPAAAADAPRVALDTSKGRIVLELDAGAAPATVENFLAYVRDGFYDGTVFHRVIPGFMAQGGGFTAGPGGALTKKATRDPIRNEAAEALSNARGTIAMARTGDPHSATAQFFVNVADNSRLDHGKPPGGWGYTAFGRVVEGMDVVDAIVAVPTGTVRVDGMPMENVPREPVVIEKATVLAAAPAGG